MVGHGGSSAGSYLADPTSPIPSNYASIVATSTLRVKFSPPNDANQWSIHVIPILCSACLIENWSWVRFPFHSLIDTKQWSKISNRVYWAVCFERPCQQTGHERALFDWVGSTCVNVKKSIWKCRLWIRLYTCSVQMWDNPWWVQILVVGRRQKELDGP